MFWTRKTEPLNVFSWKLLNDWWKAATFSRKLRWVHLKPIS